MPGSVKDPFRPDWMQTIVEVGWGGGLIVSARGLADYFVEGGVGHESNFVFTQDATIRVTSDQAGAVVFDDVIGTGISTISLPPDNELNFYNANSVPPGVAAPSPLPPDNDFFSLPEFDHFMQAVTQKNTHNQYLRRFAWSDRRSGRNKQTGSGVHRVRTAGFFFANLAAVAQASGALKLVDFVLTFPGAGGSPAPTGSVFAVELVLYKITNTDGVLSFPVIGAVGDTTLDFPSGVTLSARVNVAEQTITEL